MCRWNIDWPPECVKVTLNTQKASQNSFLVWAHKHIAQFDLRAGGRAISQNIWEAIRKPIREQIDESIGKSYSESFFPNRLLAERWLLSVLSGLFKMKVDPKSKPQGCEESALPGCTVRVPLYSSFSLTVSLCTNMTIMTIFLNGCRYLCVERIWKYSI